jgi:hypothetical protein
MPAAPEPGASSPAYLVDSGGDHHRIVLAADRVKGQVAADVAVQHIGHAALAQLFVAAHHHVLFQLEAGDAIGQQPARAVVAVIDRDLHAGAAQHVCRRQPAGAGADDAHRFGPFGVRADRLDPAFVPGGIGDVFLDRADGHGAVARLFDDAIAFAQPVLRADAAADFGEGVGGLAQLIGLLQPALGGQPQPVGDVVVQGAMRLAIGHAALAAPAGLLGGLGVGEFAVDLVEIPGAQGCVAFLGHFLAQGHELQHLLRGHGCASQRLLRVRLPIPVPAQIKVSKSYLIAAFLVEGTACLPFSAEIRSV